LVKNDVVIFHPALFPKTLNKCKKAGVITVGMATVGHPFYVAKLKRNEFEMLGQPIGKGGGFSRRGSQPDFDYIIAFSEFVKKTYVEVGFPKDKIFVANPDIDYLKFIPTKNKKSDKFKLLYVASTTPLKGLQYLLGAWESLDLKNAELTIVGGYKKIPPELKERFDGVIKSDPAIKDIGHTSDVKKYYNEASAFILPSLTEGFGRVTLEAMSCGLPVIVTENGRGIVEDGKSGFVVPIRDSEAIKEKIQFLYDNPDIADEMGKKARRAVENKQDFGDAVFEIYQEILRRKDRI
jgi:glycosyltransferase involved in cell wall biosynthesis